MGTVKKNARYHVITPPFYPMALSLNDNHLACLLGTLLQLHILFCTIYYEIMLERESFKIYVITHAIFRKALSFLDEKMERMKWPRQQDRQENDLFCCYNINLDIHEDQLCDNRSSCQPHHMWFIWQALCSMAPCNPHCLLGQLTQLTPYLLTGIWGQDDCCFILSSSSCAYYYSSHSPDGS